MLFKSFPVAPFVAGYFQFKSWKDFLPRSCLFHNLPLKLLKIFYIYNAIRVVEPERPFL